MRKEDNGGMWGRITGGIKGDNVILWVGQWRNARYGIMEERQMEEECDEGRNRGFREEGRIKQMKMKELEWENEMKNNGGFTVEENRDNEGLMWKK